MKVFVLLQCIDYEGSMVEGIFTDKSVADHLAVELQAPFRNSSISFEVQEWELDEPAPWIKERE